jgi:hypothetical protein
MKPKQIVAENFKGLSEFIKDKDILHFYEDLIETCLTEYARECCKEQGERLKNLRRYGIYHDGLITNDNGRWIDYNDMIFTLNKPPEGL